MRSVREKDRATNRTYFRKPTHPDKMAVRRRRPEGGTERRAEWFLAALAASLLAAWLFVLGYTALAAYDPGSGSGFGALQYTLQNAGHSQALTTLIILSSYISFRFFMTRQDSGFWASRPTRLAVGAIGWGTISSFICYSGETLLPLILEIPPSLDRYLQVAMGAMIHMTGAVIVILVASAFWYSVSVLHDTATPFRRFAAFVLSPRVISTLVGVTALMALVVAFFVATARVPVGVYDLRADLSPYGHLYRILASGFVTLYALVITAVLHDAHVSGAHGPSFARRWSYLRLALLGFAMLEAISILVPLLAEARPQSLLAAYPGAVTRLGEIPAFALIGWGAFSGFAGRPEPSTSGRRLHYKNLYKFTLEDLEHRTLSLEPRRISERQAERSLITLTGPDLCQDELDRAQIILALLRLSTHPHHKHNLHKKLYLLDFLHRAFLIITNPGTETYRRAQNDRISPLAYIAAYLIQRPHIDPPDEAGPDDSVPPYAWTAYRIWTAQNDAGDPYGQESRTSEISTPSSVNPPGHTH